jgi:hypothetical protein
MTAASTTREVRDSASEIKFSVDTATGSRIRERARQLLSPDPWASGPSADEYTTTTLYFDTADYAVYGRRGSYRRAKYRIRRYGESDLVFLERKLRTSECLTKRRTTVRIEDLPLLTATSVESSWHGNWFLERLLMRKLGTVCQVAYRRTARVGMTDYGPIRLTIDEDLHGVVVDQPAFTSQNGAAQLTPQTIIEMKFRAAMPAVFKQIVEEFALQPQRLSKYRLGLEATRPEAVAAVNARLKAAALEGSRA